MKTKDNSSLVAFVVFAMCVLVIIVLSALVTRAIVNSDLPEWVKMWMLTAK